jgi:hypothetical protein
MHAPLCSNNSITIKYKKMATLTTKDKAKLAPTAAKNVQVEKKAPMKKEDKADDEHVLDAPVSKTTKKAVAKK